MTGKTFALTAAAAAIATVPSVSAADHGVNVELIAAGDGIVQPLPPTPATRGAPGATWALSGWFKPDASIAGGTSLVRLTDAAGMVLAELSGGDGVIAARVGASSVTGRAVLAPGAWTFVTLTVDAGQLRLSIGGRTVAEGRVAPIGTAPTALTIAPREAGGRGFTGRIATLDWRAATGAIGGGKPPQDALVTFAPNSPHWAVQTKQQLGQEKPQPPETLPVSRAPFSAPRVRPLPKVAALAPVSAGRWAVNGWQLAAAPDLPKGLDGAALSGPADPAGRWYPATVPGTVLTTLVDRGVYPDPAFGLNNMAIPEVLNRQDYWYRTVFTAPASAPGKRLFLRFDGVNYAAEVWLNGRRLGDMRGAFIRGRFDVTGLLRSGERAVVAVRVSPAPHPGLPHEESLTAGAGENGGMMVIDGPTFVASEGWDWIPSVRDRNTGLWQGVGLEESGDVRVGDVQVVTSLPRADNSIADVRLEVPVENLVDLPVTTTVAARFDDVAVAREVALAPRERRTVTFTPREFPQLSVRNPRLWWPNGYGAAALHDLTMTASIGGAVADSRSVRFGMRTVTYETSLVDAGGRLRRLAVDLTRARETGRPIIDATHEGIRQVRGGGWAPSLAPGAEGSPAIRDIVDDDELAPNLVIRVNGVRIAARGGNWGMDDFMKRVERTRLEPFFRLHRNAHLNIIRNWVGQNTEDVFFDLADEYGMLVLSDFWESTQNYNQQADDTALFMANANDVVKRFRHHPSIIAWIGRNEGVPQPTLNAALQRLIDTEDGTRLYLPSSNRINLAVSGPYEWREPEVYFTRNGKGFAIEVGTPSFPTLESWKRTMAPADLWPISDAWAYHDWHQDKGGAVGTYLAAIRTRFGEATNLDDFEKRAQMLQFDSYRAIFEGMNAGLWKTNSGRMLWMTQAAWPSSAWNIYSTDYDAQASYYAVKSASEPVHVQMNLPDRRVVLVNNTVKPLSGVTVRASVVDLAGRTLVRGETRVDAPAGVVTAVSPVAEGALTPSVAAIVRLEAVDAGGAVLSRNSYWQAVTPAGLQAMTTMAQVPLTIAARQAREGDETVVMVDVINGATAPAVETKLTLFDSQGAQVLPAYYDDNYLTLLPGERRTVAVRVPGKPLAAGARIAVRGWNVVPARIAVRP